ncbi:MAG: VCBS repeat-containing protein, partial [Ferruginibacter sp.]|nr:VCBS repeat-containing protein [Ferruginibacter sp.]
MKLSIFILSISVILSFSNCKNPTSGGYQNENNAEKSIDPIIAKRTFEWNKANAKKDIGALSDLYCESIFYYGTQKNKNACIENKLTFFKKHPDYYQQIIGEIEVEELQSGVYKSSFLKRVNFDQKTNDYPSYLIFNTNEGEWKISTEGDLVTDKNIAKSKKNEAPKQSVQGDFNGDGKMDYVWLQTPKLKSDMDCVG